MKKFTFLILTLLLTIIGFSQTTPGKYTVSNLKSNSNNSDFGPTLFGESKIIFSSSRGIGKKWEGNNQPFLDLYTGTVNEDGSVNKVKKFLSNTDSKYHESSVSFTPNQKAVFFTRNNKYDDNLNIVKVIDSVSVHSDSSKIKKIRKKRRERFKENELAKEKKLKTTYLAIYRAEVINGKWVNIEPLPFNNRNYSVGHPSVNRDGTKLYFTSDMPGSYGKSDIFVVDILSDSTYSKPKNLGRKINTLGSEMFPYIDSKNILYFSSDSRTGGLGNLDIYATKIYDKSISDALHLGVPINSEFDDFAYALNNNINQGYFSSNRKNGKGDDDIYHFSASVPLHIECTQNVSGTVKSTEKEKPISNALVTLLNKNGDQLKTVKADSKGVFNLAVPCDSELKIVASKDDFEDDFEEFKTENNPNTSLDLNLNLKPAIVCKQDVTGIVKNANTAKPISNALVRIVDKDGKDQYSVEADSKGVFNVKLPCENNFRIIASKIKFVSDTRKISTAKNPKSKLKLILNLKPEIDTTEVRIIKNKVVVNVDPIYFELNKNNINKGAAFELDKVVAIMEKYPKLIIEGGSHTDVRGKKSNNLDLSIRRANSTIAYIVSKGIDSKRITAKGYGETQPTNRCIEGVRCNDEEHAKNRRTEFVILNPEVLGYISE
ncbi:MAG: OmpA family protein [Flavobacteriaceae bacterium]|nr:OmpA family protein [Flavobacteriaceae bacterium]